MYNEERFPDNDPYQSLDQNLKFGDALNRWMLIRPRQRIVQLLKGQRVLDVCCGTGNLTAMLVAAGCQAVGVDSSATMLSHARQKHIAAEFKQMDARQLLFDGEFDAAVISIALHEMPQQAREQAWESMCKAVHPEGHLITLDFTIPQRNNLLARFASGLTELDERGTLNYHPEHYKNFKEFMQAGGLLAWIQKRSQRLEAVYHYWGGSLAVVVVSRSTLEQNEASIVADQIVHGRL
jgi:ubiquinone/menaquinone biosynthesis C-methylase UbiE